MRPRSSRSKSRSPKRSSKNSPQRRPLHERSDSQNNKRTDESATVQEDDSVYSKDPFPRLPSQVLTPNESSSFVYEDNSQHVASNIGPSNFTPKKPSQQRSQIPTPYGKHTRSGKTNTATRRKPVGSGSKSAIPPIALPPPRSAKSAAPLIDFWERHASASRSQTPSIKSRASSARGSRSFARTPTPKSTPKLEGQNTPVFTESAQTPDSVVVRNEAQLQSTGDSFVAEADDIPVHKLENEPQETPEDQNPEDLTSSFEHNATEYKSVEQDGPKDASTKDSEETEYRSIVRILPNDSQSANAPPLVHSGSKASDGTSTSGPDMDVQRPRSASVPSAPTDAFIQALTSDSTQTQYPRMRQPSLTSLGTESSSIRTAYPAPLRLHRAPGNINLAGAALMSNPNPRYRSPVRSPVTNNPRHERARTSDLTSFEIEHQENPEIIIHQTGSAHIRVSGRWTEELQDTVSELQSRSLRPQRSWVHRRSSSETRPSTQSSVVSTGGFFYHFLNDSYTAWARAYYRGDGKLRLETPPVVTKIGRPSTPEAKPPSSSVSGPTDSPESVGYIEAIYVPRARPLRGEQPRQHSLSIRRVSSESVIEPQERPHLPQPEIQPLPLPYVGPKPKTPHLTQDRELGYSLPKWRTPSVEEGMGVFDKVNRQIALFCLGFIFPLAWLLAAVLPVPQRPAWQQNAQSKETDESQPDDLIDLFDAREIRRFRKGRRWRATNRIMSIIGLCIIAVIIACVVAANDR